MWCVTAGITHTNEFSSTTLVRRSALQSILDDIQRLVYSRGTVVMACQLAQFVWNSLRCV